MTREYMHYCACVIENMKQGFWISLLRLRSFSRIVGAVSFAGMTILMLHVASAGPIHTGMVHVQNSSFESPAADLADPRMDGWQKAPEPAWYQGGGGFAW